MSGICGLVDFDALGETAQPADDVAALLRRMTAAAAYRGPDGGGSAVSGAAGLAHLALHATPESIAEQQPLVSGDGEGLLVADARLDNRTELIAALGRRNGTPGDGELILAAYRRWGVRCPERLLGDFAFAVWDRRERRLFCARDPFGAKPLVWARTGAHFCFASEVAQVLEHPAVDRRLDEIAASAYLAGLGEDLERTYFAAVRRLPPAHRLTATAEGVTVERYWDVDPQARLRFRRAEESAERFLELFRRAVGDRLRATGDAVGLTLSGGLDSTAVAAVACELLAQHGGPRPVAGSFVFDHLSECDERSYLRPLAAALNLETVEVPADRPWRLGEFAATRFDADSPALGWEPAHRELLEALRQRGARLLLTGIGGDEIAAGSPRTWSDRLRRGDLGALKEIAHHARWRGMPLWLAFYYDAAAPLLPPSVVRGLRRLAGRRPAPVWIHRSFARRTCLPARANTLPPRRFGDRARQEIYDLLVADGHTTAAIALQERLAARFGFEVRHPFVDRRLFEFVLAIPPQHLYQAGCFKPLLRRAMRGILPEAVRQRQDKTSFANLIDQLLWRSADEIEEILAAPLLVELGWVDRDRLRAAWRRYAAGGADPSSRQLWYAIALEVWLRRHAGLAASPDGGEASRMGTGGRGRETSKGKQQR